MTYDQVFEMAQQDFAAMHARVVRELPEGRAPITTGSRGATLYNYGVYWEKCSVIPPDLLCMCTYGPDGDAPIIIILDILDGPTSLRGCKAAYIYMCNS
jgi:hypothetical protein